MCIVQPPTPASAYEPLAAAGTKQAAKGPSSLLRRAAMSLHRKSALLLSSALAKMSCQHGFK